MLFRSKGRKATGDVDGKVVRYGDYTEQEITDILRAYGTTYYEELTSAKNEWAEAARERLERADSMIGMTGVGAALAPTLVEHIMHWHAWISHDDFSTYVGFPASDIFAVEIVAPDGVRFAEEVSFVYGAQSYIVRVLLDAKHSLEDDELRQYGKISVYIGEVEVISLGMSLRLDQEYAVWRWEGVFAFLPGLWMKDLIEIGAHIEAFRVNATKRIVDDDAIRRGQNVSL